MLQTKYSLCTITLLCLGIFSVASFILTPMTGDIMVFLSGANQVQFSQAKGILGAIETWELKGPISRIITYLLYSASLLFTDFGTDTYMRVFKGAYAFFLVSVLAASSVLLSRSFPKFKENTINIFLFLVISFMLVPYSMHIQTEMTALAFLVLATACASFTSRSGMLLGGMLCGSIFFIKSIVILLAASLCVALYLVGRTKNFLFFVGGFFLVTGICIVGLYVFFPQEISDTMYAGLFQPTLLSPQTKIDMDLLIERRFFFRAVKFLFLLLPTAFIGVACTVLLLQSKTANLKKLLLPALWVPPFLVIAISNCYFDYHFFLYIFPGLVIMFITLLTQHKDINNLKISQIFLLILIFLATLLIDKNIYHLFSSNFIPWLLLLFCLIFLTIAHNNIKSKYFLFLIIFISLIPISNTIKYTSFTSRLAKEANTGYALASSHNKSINSIIDDDEQILFLDDGSAPYFVNKKSYLRYYYPLPLQRSTGKDLLSKTDMYEKLKKKLLSYSGNYIIIDERWFFSGETSFFKDKLHNEYTKTNDIILIPNIHWEYYTDREGNPVGSISIYKRK